MTKEPLYEIHDAHGALRVRLPCVDWSENFIREGFHARLGSILVRTPYRKLLQITFRLIEPSGWTTSSQ
jgi:hypothetical protein